MFLPILRLIRLPNLLIIAFTMITIRYGVLKPFLNALSLELPTLYFLFIVTSVVLIAAGGYMINDYFDVDTDNINKPNKVLIGKVFTSNSVLNAYIVINVISIALAFFVSYKLGFTKLFLIFPLTVGLLWFYSNTYKNQFLIGNILISGFIACVTMIPALYELPVVFSKYKDIIDPGEMKYFYIPAGIFAAFAFIANLIREITKDAEDYEGDNATGSRTLPIVLGIKTTKIIINLLNVIFLACLVWILKTFLLYNTATEKLDIISLLYFICFLFVPIIISGYYVFMADSRKGFSLAALFQKIVMIFGILYAWILAFNI
jgi:4-hydroxybenzoate polyprenyltransferase